MKVFRSIVVVMPVLLAASIAFAQHQTFTVNSEASAVKMMLKTNHEIVNGNFHVQSGTIAYDPGTYSMNGNMVVAAGSGTTGNESRDKKMSKDVLKVEQYATISFSPKSYTGAIVPAGDSTIQVSGVFTLLGPPHDLTISMQLHTEAGKCTAAAHLVVPYVAWGLKNPSFLVWKAEKEVDVDLNLVGPLSN